MAMNTFDNHPSSSRRQKLFSRDLVGEFVFALERPKGRQELFLQRNISQILGYHEQRLKQDTASTDSRLLPASNSGTTTDVSKTASILNGVVNDTLTNGVSAAANAAATSDMTPAPSTDMPTRSQFPAPKSLQRERSKRRSDRFKEVLDRVYEQPDAELILDLNSIRKKLNFKTNSLGDGERPSKRQKRDTVRCYCHLTIWDNRDGHAATPLTTKSSYCRVTGTDNGAHGHFVDLELEAPFVVKASEIRVPVSKDRLSTLEIIDNYFLEIKVIPCRADSRWPPMPLLGKSDGDNFAHDIRKVGSEELQGAIVARYTHLPTAPDADVPLSVFFLEQSDTYRTKYGLQVQSYWQKASARPVKLEPRGLDLEDFLQERRNGINQSAGANGLLKASTVAPLNASLKPPPKPPPEVCYSLSGRMSEYPDIAQEFRNATVKGYCCPLCRMPPFLKLQLLQFHLTTTHSKYNFSVQKPRQDPFSNEISQIHIKVEKTTRPFVKKGEDEKPITWIAPKPAFDIQKFASGDHAWTNGTNGTTAPSKIQSSTSTYARARNVPEFRQPNRRKLKAITLETRHIQDDPEAVYTSVSHRAISPSEDPQSETDDEIDNEWQISTHMERLDIMTAQENRPPCERELLKRWDRHRMEEQLEHSTYLSNSLARFVKKQREWLRGSENDELLACFFEFLARLKDRRVVDDDLIADINELIFVDPLSPPQPSPTKKAAETAKSGALAPIPPVTLPTVPPPQQTCALCALLILNPHFTTYFCQDRTCSTPSQKYHRRCILSNTQPPVIKRDTSSILNLSIANDRDNQTLKSWSCPLCVAGHRAISRARVEERMELKRAEREVVEKMVLNDCPRMD